ncbi:MAG: guanylate kinase [Bacteroidales bacterium]|nr:guanylate kinase [Bacteroidales bacterium]
MNQNIPIDSTATNGRLIIFSAPSGAGKTTIMRHLLQHLPQLEFSVSACSRPPRPGEVDGRDYHFMSEPDFRARAERGEFVEWEEVYPGHLYGTLWSELHRIWANGHVVAFDVDVKGGLNLKRKFPSSALAVFIMPPSVEALRQRLLARNTETLEKVEMRVRRAELEMAQAPSFDTIVLNDVLEEAQGQALSLVSEWLLGGL